ncbi:MAG: prepilin-type N-terminal cleavage/methylation domain-containing protein [Chloroflexi bacterium]|nr:prepilin-type N-terminal cleavage/methylation domain-containing protein [Chloroflexota bacterium]
MKTISNSQRGFTLVEVLIVVAVLAVLAAIVTPAVSGVISSARAQGKEGDIKNVETGVQRYSADNANALPITGTTEPTASVAIVASTDNVIRVKVDTLATNPSDFTSLAADVTCGSGTEVMTLALAQCFGALDFAGKLVPDYVKAAPKHATDAVTVLAADLVTGADLTLTGADSSKNTIEFYLDAAIASGDGLKVWNVDADSKIIVLKNDVDYGKA